MKKESFIWTASYKKRFTIFICVRFLAKIPDWKWFWVKTTKFSFLIYEQLKNEEDQVTSRSTRNLFKHCTSPACRLNSFVIERQLKNIASQCTFSTKTQHKREEITSWLPLYMRPSQHCKSNDAHLVTFPCRENTVTLIVSVNSKNKA